MQLECSSITPSRCTGRAKTLRRITAIPSIQTRRVALPRDDRVEPETNTLRSSSSPDVTLHFFISSSPRPGCARGYHPSDDSLHSFLKSLRIFSTSVQKPNSHPPFRGVCAGYSRRCYSDSTCLFTCWWGSRLGFPATRRSAVHRRKGGGKPFKINQLEKYTKCQRHRLNSSYTIARAKHNIVVVDIPEHITSATTATCLARDAGQVEISGSITIASHLQ